MIVENSPDLIQVISPKSRLLYVNRSWRETLGYESQDLASLNFFDLLSADPQRFNDKGLAGLDDRSGSVTPVFWVLLPASRNPGSPDRIRPRSEIAALGGV